MPRKTNPYWTLHTNVLRVVNTPSQQGSGTRLWACKYCGEQYTSSITRVVRHLTGKECTNQCGPCKAVPQDIRDELIQKHYPAMGSANNVGGGRSTEDALHEAFIGGVTGTGAHGASSVQKRPRIGGDDEDLLPHGSGTGEAARQTTLPSRITSQSWVKERQRVAEMEIARTLIDCNIAFNVLRTDQWKRMVRAIAQVGPTESWTGLDYKKMRTTMLDEQKALIDKALVPVKSGWQEFGCTIISDGWADVRRRHIINILVSSCLGTYFLGAVDAGKAGEKITGEFIYGHIRQAILEVGPENVVQVVTDNASNCKAMGTMVEAEFPRIVWTPCAAHCLDLLMEDIGRLSWVQPIVADAVKITTFFRKKHGALAIFRSHSTLDMVRPSKTRFAYIYLVLQRLYKLRDPLLQTVVDPKWREMHHSQEERTKYLQRRILDDTFWQEVQGLTVALQPVYVLLRVTDREGSTLGLVFHLFMQMKAHVSQCSKLTTER